MGILVKHSSENTGRGIFHYHLVMRKKNYWNIVIWNAPDSFCDNSAPFITLHSWQAECLHLYIGFVQGSSSHWLRTVSVRVQWINISCPARLEFNIHRVQEHKSNWLKEYLKAAIKVTLVLSPQHTLPFPIEGLVSDLSTAHEWHPLHRWLCMW